MTSLLEPLIAAGVVIGVVLTGLGFLARWWPAFDIVNNFVPIVAAGSVLLLCLAAIMRDWRLIVPAALVAAINVVLFVAPWQSGASQAATGSPRFLRVVTFNLWRGNDRMDNVAKFLAGTDADLVVLQEVTREHGSTLHEALGSR